MSRGDGVMTRTRYLSRIGVDGAEDVRYLETTTEREMQNFGWNEEEEYFVHMGGCALGPEGHVYAAPKRDSYTIDVYGADGALERVIERDFVPRKRSREDKERIENTSRVRFRRRQVEQEISDYDPCITRFWVGEEGKLWVLHSCSDREQPPGIFQTYDIFDPEGHYIRQVSVSCAGDPRRDGFFLLGSDQAVLVTGLVEAAIAMTGSPGREGELGEDTAPSEIICYRVIED